jgi:hypothetical protein
MYQLSQMNSFVNFRRHRHMQQCQLRQTGCWGNFSDNYHQNFQDVRTGGYNPTWRRGCRRFEPTRGYGIDLNKNGRFDRGKDGVLVFDMNRDGKYDKKDVSNTNKMMKAATGNFDFDGNGRVSPSERMMGQVLRRKFARLDRNRDGRLSAHEMNQAGGKVWIDRSKGGGVGKNELHSVYQIPSEFIGGTTKTLDFVDPYCRTSGTSNNRPYWPHGQGTGWIPSEGCQPRHMNHFFG